MKTLHLSIIVISLILIGASNFSIAQISKQIGGVAIPHISTSKSNFTDGDIIPINGYALPDSTTNIFLVNNYGNIENSTQVKSNNTGDFNTSLGIPSRVIGGAWVLFATNGESGFAMQVMVNFHGANTPPFDFPSGLPPLKQLKFVINPSYVQCRTELQLIIKSEDGSPACVKPDSIAKLVGRGWAVPHIMNFGYNPGRGPATLEQRDTSTSINQQIEQVAPSCVSNIPHQYAIAGPPGFPLCPIMNFQASAKILKASGFYGIYNYTKYPGTTNFVLEPGHNGTITYLVSMGMIREFSDTLQHSDKINITNGVSFMHDAGMNNHPGIDLAVEPKLETMQSNSTALVTITFLASKDAPLGTYWVTLPPGTCAGGEMIILTVTDCGK